MVYVKCTQKFRNRKTGKIYGYRLQDCNRRTIDITPDNLKEAIRNNQLNVINLKLTSDGRLVDKKYDTLKNKSFGKAPLWKMADQGIGYIFDTL